VPLHFKDAFEKVAAHAARPSALLVTDPTVWGLERGMRQVIVFDWSAVEGSLVAPFLEWAFGELLNNATFIDRTDAGLSWVNSAVVPFAILGRELHASGTTFESAFASRFEAVLLFDLEKGQRNQCPVLLWDGRRFGKVVNDASMLGLRQAVPAARSAKDPDAGYVVEMVPRLFVHITIKETRYWQIGVSGRRISMQRGVLKPTGQKDWATNESKEGEFATAAEATQQARALMEKYLADGYIERESLDE
jgi:hypothetical protein